jgi:F-type H+-transporting ATPase subunit b
MHIDWFVLAAQIFNFLVLVFLLKHLLYNRIIGAMDTREAKIASRFQEADRLLSEAQQSLQACDERNRQLSERAEEMMLQAQKAAEREKEGLMDRGREEVELVRKRWYEGMSMEKKAFLEGLRRRAGMYVYDTIRHVLEDMANEDLEDRIVQVFVSRIGALDRAQQGKLRDSLNAGARTVVIRSAFPLNPDSRKTIDAAVRPYTGDKVPIRYEVTQGIGAGIELMAHGYKVSWSINDYLSDLEEKFVRSLKEEIRVDVQTV